VKTCAIKLKCDGDEKHPSHTDTIMLLVLIDSPDEIDKIDSLYVALCLLEPLEDVHEIFRDSEGIGKITEAIKLALVATQPNDEDEGVFEGVKEVDPEVDFL
jgi:hypothetical protein